MRKIVVCCLPLFMAIGAHAAGVEVKFAIGEWAPYTGKQLPEYGAASEVVTAAAKAAGLTPVYVFEPWKRAEDDVANGSAFATFPYRKTAERAVIYNFTDPFMRSSAGILRYTGNPKSNISYAKIENLQPFIVGCTAGSEATVNPLKAAKVRVEETPTFDATLLKLASSRVDFAIEDKVVAFDAVKRLFPNETKNFKFLNKDFTPANPMYLLVSKKYPDNAQLLKKFNAGLKKIAENGTMAKIYAKYGL